jgi:hypothetical protein
MPSRRRRTFPRTYRLSAAFAAAVREMDPSTPLPRQAVHVIEPGGGGLRGLESNFRKLQRDETPNREERRCR